jgi:hypothetical protein
LKTHQHPGTRDDSRISAGLLRTRLSPHVRALAWLLVALWLALALPRIDTRYSYNWDSSQFERGVRHFDIAAYQPHPPGYPLWILALRGMTPMVGRVNSAQIVLAMLFTAAGLVFFRFLARETLGERAGFAAVVALAFSPTVFLHAIASVNYAVDLFASCAIGFLALRLWQGEAHRAPLAFAIAAVTAGFRPSGVTFLLPLLLAATWRARRTSRLYVATGVAVGAVLWLAWYVPTALLTGGFAKLSALNRSQLLFSVRETSIFFGAPPIAQVHMFGNVCIFIGLALVSLAPVLLWHCRSWQGGQLWRAPVFMALWLIPNLAFISLLHIGNAGYVVLSLPPLVLMSVELVRPSFDRLRWIVVVVAVSLIASYFPYERFVNPGAATVPLQLLRASPRMAWLVEANQRQLRTLIDELPGRPEQKLVVCLRVQPEAPNIRTVTEEFTDVYWATDDSSTTPATVRTLAWLCDGSGLPAPIHARYPQARRLGGNNLYSFWAIE